MLMLYSNIAESEQLRNSSATQTKNEFLNPAWALNCSTCLWITYDTRILKSDKKVAKKDTASQGLGKPRGRTWQPGDEIKP